MTKKISSLIILFCGVLICISGGVNILFDFSRHVGETSLISYFLILLGFTFILEYISKLEKRNSKKSIFEKTDLVFTYLLMIFIIVIAYKETVLVFKVIWIAISVLYILVSYMKTKRIVKKKD